MEKKIMMTSNNQTAKVVQVYYILSSEGVKAAPVANIM